MGAFSRGPVPLVTVLMFAVAAYPVRAQTPAPPLLLASAQKIIAAAQRKATEIHLTVSAAVVDARGDLIAFERMTGAIPATIDLALGKAILAAMFGERTVATASLGADPILGPAINDLMGGRLRFYPSAVLIIRDNVIVGALAVSGAGQNGGGGGEALDLEIVKAAMASTS